MARFGTRSTQVLSTCDPRIIDVLERAITISDFAVICGHRGELDQNRAYATGASKARWGQSAHNTFPSRAVDIAPYPINWDDTEAFVFLAGIVIACSHSLGYGDLFLWGGDWDADHRMADERFRDYPHFELKE